MGDVRMFLICYNKVRIVWCLNKYVERKVIGYDLCYYI